MSMSMSVYGKMDPRVYKAAICGRQSIETFKLEAALNDDMARGNSLLLLASRVGNSEFVERVLKLKPDLVKATNDKGNTALHEAAEGGHSKIVEILLQRDHDTSLSSMTNTLHETALFKSCQGCQACECRAESCDHLNAVKKLLDRNPSALAQKTLQGMTCLHVAVIRRNSGLLSYLLERIGVHSFDELVKGVDENGETLLHLAVRRNRVDLVRQLVKFESKLCCYVNEEEETPLLIAVKMGFVEIVDELIKCMPNTIEIPNMNGKNVLHLAVELKQVRLVEFLVKTSALRGLINQPIQTAQPNNQPEGRGGTGNKNCPPHERSGRAGDTPLHIATRVKNFTMVCLLLKVDGVNKDALNDEGLTPLDIAMENTEYLEPYKIIAKLTDYPPKCRPFMYCAPKISPEKDKRAAEMAEYTFNARRDSELVVAVLLASMTATAAFAVPGGFQTEKNKRDDVLGLPVLIAFNSFKVFLIFDFVAFGFSLLVVFMWLTNSPSTTGSKIMLMTITSLLVCASFAFTAYGFMAAAYTVLANEVEMAWAILGGFIFISVCSNIAVFCWASMFSTKRTRIHHLCGLRFPTDNLVERMWVTAEQCGIVDLTRRCDQICRDFLTFGHPLIWSKKVGDGWSAGPPSPRHRQQDV